MSVPVFYGDDADRQRWEASLSPKHVRTWVSGVIVGAILGTISGLAITVIVAKIIHIIR